MCRYQVKSRDMDGIVGYFVVDTHHPLYKSFFNEDFMSSSFTFGLSMNKKEMIALANKMNKEAAE